MQTITKTSSLQKTIMALLFLVTAIFTIRFLSPAKDPASADTTNPNQLKVVTSIQPLRLIAQAILGEDAQLDVLIPQSGNPHYYQLKPSDVRKLRDSDYFFWIGPDLESFLGKILQANNVTHIALYDHSASNEKTSPSQPPAKQAKQYNSDSIDHEHEHHSDMHLWLDPSEALHIGRIIKANMTKLSPEQKANVDMRFDTFEKRIKNLLSEYQEKFSANQKRPIYSRHNSLTHLAKRFDLNIAGSLSDTPEKRPGISHLSRLNRQITQDRAICYIVDSIGNDKYLKGISGSVEVHKTRIDILANDTQNTETGYITFIRNLLDDIYECAYSG